MGGKESVINLSLSVLPVSVLIPGVFLMCCLISTAIGTSMGTSPPWLRWPSAWPREPGSTWLRSAPR